MDIIILISVIAFLLLLVAGAAACFVHFSSLRTQGHEAQRFVDALEDLVLPLGSFPSELLGRSASIVTDLADSDSGVEGEGEREQQDEDEREQQEEEETEQQKDEETEQQEDHETVTDGADESPTPSQVFENAIRELVDPDGTSGSNLHTLAELVKDAIDRGAKAEDISRSKAAMLQRAEEDLRHEWADKKEVWEKVITGQNHSLNRQNLAVRSLTIENMRLGGENRGFHDVAKERRAHLRRCYNERLEILIAAKQRAEREREEAELEKEDMEKEKEEALTGVQERINIGLENLKKENSEAKRKHQHEKNSLICSRRMVDDDLLKARQQLAEAAKEHETAAKSNRTTIDQLKADLREVVSRKTTSEDVAASDMRRLEKRSELQCKERDDKIKSLNDQLRRANESLKELGEYKTKAQAAEQRSQRLSDQLKEETTRLRENKEHAVSKLRLELGGHKMTIKANEDEMRQMQANITALETGEELQTLKSQVQKSKKQLRASAKETQDAKKQAQDQQHEMEGLRRTIKAQGDEISESSTKASNEKDELKKQLEDFARASDEKLKRAVEKCKRDHEEDKNKAVQDAVKNTTAAAKADEENLRQTLQRQLDGERQSSQQTQEEITAAIRLAEENARQTLQSQFDGERQSSWQAQEQSTAAARAGEESLRQTFQKQIDDEREKSRRAQEQMTVAAKLAEQTVRQTLEKQLDAERQSSRQAREQATKIENDLRAEMRGLKSQVGQDTEPQNTHSASPEGSRDAQALKQVDMEAIDANNLLLEIASNGVVKGSVQHALLCELNRAKLALYRVKCETQKSDAATDKGRLAGLIDGVIISEQLTQRLNENTQLVRQAQMVNARVQNLQKVLEEAAEGVPKDAVHEALQSTIPFAREIKKLRRPLKPRQGMQPSTISSGSQAESSTANAQRQVEGVSTPFADILATLRLPISCDQTPATAAPNAVPEDEGASSTTAEAQSPLPGLQAEGQTSADISARPKRNIRSRKVFPEQRTASPPSDQPQGWTDEMTAAVKDMLGHGDDGVQIEETIKALYDLQEDSMEGLEKWLEKLQSEYETERKDRM